MAVPHLPVILRWTGFLARWAPSPPVTQILPLPEDCTREGRYPESNLAGVGRVAFCLDGPCLVSAPAESPQNQPWQQSSAMWKKKWDWAELTVLLCIVNIFSSLRVQGFWAQFSGSDFGGYCWWRFWKLSKHLLCMGEDAIWVKDVSLHGKPF